MIGKPPWHVLPEGAQWRVLGYDTLGKRHPENLYPTEQLAQAQADFLNGKWERAQFKLSR